MEPGGRSYTFRFVFLLLRVRPPLVASGPRPLEQV